MESTAPAPVVGTEFLRPTTLRAALETKAQYPDAVPIAGGTDVMVELNFGRSRPSALLDLTGIAECDEWSVDSGVVRLGAGVSYARVISDLADRLPGLAMASRTVGSPQIRNRGTIAGNLGSASPAGDTLPPLVASDASVELSSVRGSRRVRAAEYCTGPKRSLLAEDELITAIHVPEATGPQQFSKVGPRNAMVIAVCSFALSLSPGRVGTGIGSAGPTPLTAPDAEAFLASELDGWWESPSPLADSVVRRFGELVAEATAPIDDVRGSARYRRHALAVLARRTLTWACAEGAAR